MQTRSFIGMDVHKATISISIAEDGRDGPVRFLGVIPKAPDEIARWPNGSQNMGSLSSATRLVVAATTSNQTSPTFNALESSLMLSGIHATCLVGTAAANEKEFVASVSQDT